MQRDTKAGRVTASIEEISLSNAVLVEALSQLLVETGVLNRDQIIERVARIRKEMNLRKPQTR
jgi:hypothetical protein